ncbi:MAG: hypothetical protein L6416_06485 [Candidatus Omnitrophica bacterium]|nr:hypothetical protein [Candidatus Omnitrophota bacterium]
MMKDKKCLNCLQRKNCGDSFVSWIFFVIGLVATVAIRIVTVLMDIHLKSEKERINYFFYICGIF